MAKTRRTKPTNRELMEGISLSHGRIDTLTSVVDNLISIVREYISYKDDTDDYMAHLKKKDSKKNDNSKIENE